MLRYVILQVINPHYHQDIALRNMRECTQLVETFGGEVLEKSIQHRVNPNPSTYIGSGKLEWLKNLVKEKKIDIVVLNSVVNAGQIFRLEKALWEVNPRIAVWDRVDLILNIFDQHATTTEAKLQIKLARIQHLGPRIYGLGGTVLSRQGGGIGTRGKGETNTEFEKRKIREETQKIKKQLKHFAHLQEKRIEKRKALGLRTVAIVGYTSAGKTTLFNALTRKGKQAHESLFTTLDSVVGKLDPAHREQKILISDTIGFIDDLPPFLIDAFRSTLMESLEADVLLHVIDSSDEQMEEKIAVVEKILAELGAHQTTILVFNKVDLLSPEQIDAIDKKFATKKRIFISAQEKQGLDTLKEIVMKTSQKE